MSIISNTMTEIRNDLQNATSTVDHHPDSIFWVAMDSIERSKTSFYLPTTLDTGKSQRVSSIGWSDYAIEAVEEDCCGSECETVDPMSAKMEAMELRMLALENRMYEMTDKAEKAQRETIALRAKLQNLEISNQSLEYRVQQLMQSRYTDNARQYTDNTNYQMMLQRILTLEQASNPLRQPYWGGQINCGTSTSLPCTSASDVEALRSSTWASVGATAASITSAIGAKSIYYTNSTI